MSNSKVFRLLIFAVVFFMSSCIFSQFLTGIDGGMTYNGLTGDSPKDADYKRKIGFTFGGQFEFHIAEDITSGLGLRYFRTGTIITYDIGEKETKDSFDISVSYISIPLTFKVFTGAKKTFFSSGLDLKFLLNAELKNLEKSQEKKSIKEEFQNYEVSVFAGYGAFFPIGFTSIGLELRYAHSLNNISREGSYNSSGLPARFRFSGFQLLVSVYYSRK